MKVEGYRWEWRKKVDKGRKGRKRPLLELFELLCVPVISILLTPNRLSRKNVISSTSQKRNRGYGCTTTCQGPQLALAVPNFFQVPAHKAFSHSRPLLWCLLCP